jgi:xylan 1,4-beta-xylosidase
MKSPFLVILLVTLIFSCSQKQQEAEIAYFTNPILAGFYPDPSMCKVGEDYYLTTSTFTYFPGLPIFHSKDLVNWKLIGHVLTKPEIFNVEGSGVSRGLFAPSIRHDNGLFYVVCTLIDRGGNFISTATDPAGPWSDPVWVPEVEGIDPSPFFDDDGRAYLIYNSVAPDNEPLYSGHRTIRLREFDKASLKVIDEEVLLMNGGVDLGKNPIWIEAPHIFKKNGFYYLICAEGGTGYQHSEVVFRSESVKGPYIPYDKNPILTQRHLDPNRPNPITTTGHADFVETDDGEWWAVFLGCRPYYDKDYYNIGRETFLAPVQWIDGWPVINPDFEEVQYSYPYPLPRVENGRPRSGNFSYRDDFDADELDIEWMFLRAPKEKWYTISQGKLGIKVRPETCIEKVNPSFVGHRQQHITSSAAVSVDFTAQSENEKAGLLIYQSEYSFYFLCQSVKAGKRMVELYQSPSANERDMLLVASAELEDDSSTVQLKIASNPEAYSFYYSSGDEWILLKDNMDPKLLSTKVAGGFVGSIYAMYATCQGEPGNNTAYFDWFEYSGNDAVYNSND